MFSRFLKMSSKCSFLIVISGSVLVVPSLKLGGRGKGGGGGRE